MNLDIFSLSQEKSFINNYPHLSISDIGEYLREKELLDLVIKILVDRVSDTNKSFELYFKNKVDRGDFFTNVVEKLNLKKYEDTNMYWNNTSELYIVPCWYTSVPSLDKYSSLLTIVFKK